MGPIHGAARFGVKPKRVLEIYGSLLKDCKSRSTSGPSAVHTNRCACGALPLASQTSLVRQATRSGNRSAISLTSLPYPTSGKPHHSFHQSVLDFQGVTYAPGKDAANVSVPCLFNI